MDHPSEKVHCLIIGSGPAGYSAAIYAARANLKPVMYQGIQPGGQLTITTEVENYPGYPDGVQGPEMMVHFEKQAARMGTDIRYGLATKVDLQKPPFKVWIDEEKIIESDTVIIATGASAKWLGIESEQRLNGFGVSACAVCDGFFSGERSCDRRRRRYGSGRSIIPFQIVQYRAYVHPAQRNARIEDHAGKSAADT